MAVVRHLGFVWCIFGPLTKGTWWSLLLCKIWLQSMQEFLKHESLNYSHVWLENGYSFCSPKIGFCGNMTPEMDININKTTSLRESASFQPCNARKSAHRSDLQVSSQKEGINKTLLYFTNSPRSSPWADLYQIWFWGSCRRRNQL